MVPPRELRADRYLRSRAVQILVGGRSAAGAGDANREAEEAGAAEGSGTEPSLGACADTITIPTAQAPDGAARELRTDQYRPARPFRYW